MCYHWRKKISMLLSLYFMKCWIVQTSSHNFEKNSIKCIYILWTKKINMFRIIFWSNKKILENRIFIYVICSINRENGLFHCLGLIVELNPQTKFLYFPNIFPFWYKLYSDSQLKCWSCIGNYPNPLVNIKTFVWLLKGSRNELM